MLAAKQLMKPRIPAHDDLSIDCKRSHVVLITPSQSARAHMCTRKILMERKEVMKLKSQKQLVAVPCGARAEPGAALTKASAAAVQYTRAEFDVGLHSLRYKTHSMHG